MNKQFWMLVLSSSYTFGMCDSMATGTIQNTIHLESEIIQKHEIDEQRVGEKLGNALLRAGDHTMNKFMERGMWQPHYRTLSDVQKKKIKIHAKIVLAQHILKKSTEELKKFEDEDS